jgi:HlyD family secretion protein
MRRAVGVGLATLALGAIVWMLIPAPVDIEVATVARGTFRRTVDEDGRTRVRERYVVSAPLAGRLLRIPLKPGDAVVPGARVATLLPAHPALLDARTEHELAERSGAAEARKLATAATVERARAALALAESEVARARDLGEKGFASKQAVERGERERELRRQELATAEFEAHAAEHDLAVARAALSRATAAGSGRDGAYRWDIVAPVAGRVLRVLQESETAVALGTPLLEIGDPSGLEVVIDVLTPDAEGIRPGTPVEFEREPGEARLDGRVRRVEPAAFTKLSALGVEEQRVNVIVDFTSPAEATRALGDAYRVDARIVVDQRADALRVPAPALFRDAGGWAVYRVADGRARRTRVTLGPRGATEAVVEAGLDAGDAVVIYPGDAIRDGVRVRAGASR